MAVTSAAKAAVIAGLNRRHKCLLHPVAAADKVAAGVFRQCLAIVAMMAIEVLGAIWIF
jgi:hypothetical protein